MSLAISRQTDEFGPDPDPNIHQLPTAYYDFDRLRNERSGTVEMDILFFSGSLIRLFDQLDSFVDLGLESRCHADRPVKVTLSFVFSAQRQ